MSECCFVCPWSCEGLVWVCMLLTVRFYSCIWLFAKYYQDNYITRKIKFSACWRDFITITIFPRTLNHSGITYLCQLLISSKDCYYQAWWIYFFKFPKVYVCSHVFLLMFVFCKRCLKLLPCVTICFYWLASFVPYSTYFCKASEKV